MYTLLKNSATSKAQAKINLFLEVGKRRSDGYHDISTVMAALPGLYDTVTVTAQSEISVTCTDSRIPAGMDNIACRAAAAFFSRTGIDGGARIHIEKRIPAAAGLAGGSADGAAVILCLNEMYGCPLTASQMLSVGASVGADVPFCIAGGVAAATGVGEKLTFLPPLPPVEIAVAIGSGEKMSTAAAYGLIDEMRRSSNVTRSADEMINAVLAGDIGKICSNLYNVFEKVTSYSGEIKDIMLGCGASGTLMSGSGPAVFGLFRDKDCASDARRALLSRGYVCG